MRRSQVGQELDHQFRIPFRFLPKEIELLLLVPIADEGCQPLDLVTCEQHEALQKGCPASDLESSEVGLVGEESERW